MLVTFDPVERSCGVERDEMTSWIFYPADFAILGLVAEHEGFRGFDRVRQLTERGELGSGVGVNKFGLPRIQGKALEYRSG